MGDVYFKKLVTLKYRGQVLQFRVAQELFSSHEVDVGTQRLLRSLLDARIDGCGKILDLGCGYGPLGLTLKKAGPERVAHLVDRDALALDYSRQNAALNELTNVEVYGSLGYSDVTARDFDLIVSNIPAKAGEPVIVSFLRDARHYMRPGGLVAVVIVSRLEEAVAGALDDPNIRVVLRKAWPGHTVWHYQFADPASQPAVPDGAGSETVAYCRGKMGVSVGRLQFSVRTAYGLPEFDTLDHRTEMLLAGMLGWQGRPVGRAVVLNPGQGHVPVAVWRLFQPSAIALVDRDLLSLRVSRANLARDGCSEKHVSLWHQVGMPLGALEKADLVAGLLREDEGPGVHAWLIGQAAEQLAPGGAAVVSGSSTAITRLETVARADKRFEVRERKRVKGDSFLVLKRHGPGV